MWKIIVIKYEHGHGDPFPTLYCAWVTFHKMKLFNQN